MVPVTMGFYNRLKGDHGTPAAQFVFDSLTEQKDFIDSPRSDFWAPLPSRSLRSLFAGPAVSGDPAVPAHRRLYRLAESRRARGLAGRQRPGVAAADVWPGRHQRHLGLLPRGVAAAP